MENDDRLLPGSEPDIEVDKTGHSPYEWDFNKDIDEEVVRADKITEDYALRVVLIPEKLDMENVKKEHLRKHASHEEFWDAEYFPYVLYKTNGCRKVLKARSFHGEFCLPPPQPKPGELTASLEAKPLKFQISKLVYQLRGELKVDRGYLDRFRKMEVDGRDIFYDLKSRVLFHLDVEEWVATTVALWIMGTHVYDLFDAYAYIYAFAERGSGKSRLLKLIYATSRLGKYWVAGRPSPLFRLVHTLHPTICIDETEELNKDDAAELLALLNAGYERGAVVPRTNTDTMIAESFEVFCPKALATTRPLSPVLESRCLRVPLKRSRSQEYQEREPLTASYLDSLTQIKENLEFWAIEQGSEIARMDKSQLFKKYQGVFEGVPPRVLQIVIPLLAVYDILRLDEDVPFRAKSANSDGTDGRIEYRNEKENLLKALEYQMTEHKTSSVNDLDQRIIVALYKCVTDPHSFRVNTGQIMKAMGIAEEEKEYITANKVGKALRKYAVPKTMLNGRAEYFYKVEPEAQVAFVKDLIARYSINVSDLDLALERRAEKGGIEGFDDEVPP
ncbi:MAG: hypothetical protein PHG80_11610 [Methanoregulaceae archaeon]|nr:hypothetical protein [Methanoregulaceae archaeon]